jgi:hypothetical protein
MLHVVRAVSWRNGIRTVTHQASINDKDMPPESLRLAPVRFKPLRRKIIRAEQQ